MAVAAASPAWALQPALSMLLQRAPLWCRCGSQCVQSSSGSVSDSGVALAGWERGGGRGAHYCLMTSL